MLSWGKATQVVSGMANGETEQSPATLNNEANRTTTLQRIGIVGQFSALPMDAFKALR